MPDPQIQHPDPLHRSTSQIHFTNSHHRSKSQVHLTDPPPRSTSQIHLTDPTSRSTSQIQLTDPPPRSTSEFGGNVSCKTWVGTCLVRSSHHLANIMSWAWMISPHQNVLFIIVPSVPMASYINGEWKVFFFCWHTPMDSYINGECFFFVGTRQPSSQLFAL